jgi:hypothetical protein
MEQTFDCCVWAASAAVTPRVILSEAVAEVDITNELRRRALPDPDYLREKLAMEICGADSAGISIREPGVRTVRLSLSQGPCNGPRIGEIEYDWRPRGLVVQVRLPLASLKS